MHPILDFLRTHNMGFAENLEKEHASWCEKHLRWESIDGHCLEKSFLHELADEINPPLSRMEHVIEDTIRHSEHVIEDTIRHSVMSIHHHHHDSPKCSPI